MTLDLTAGQQSSADGPAHRRAEEVVIALLCDITSDLDLGPLTSDRRLGDLGLESISLVYLIAEVQQEFDLGDRLIRALRRGALTDLRAMTVGAFADTVSGLLQPERAGSGTDREDVS